MLSVTGTALTAQLAPSGDKEGSAMGIFNAATALSGVLGAALGGLAASRWGYVAVPAIATAGWVWDWWPLSGLIKKIRRFLSFSSIILAA